MIDPNIEIAGLLLDLSEVYRPSARFWGYKNAARSIRRHPEFLSDLSEKEILKIPGVGPASMRIAQEYLETGESQTVARIVSESGKAKEIESRRALRRNFLSAAMVSKVLSDPKRGAVTRADYGGDFQMHSRGSDGADSIESLARACIKRGYRCMCVTDHSYGLPIARGMTMKEIRAQHAEIDAINKELGGEFRVFKGIEANILQDGSLDLHPAELPEFDLRLSALEPAEERRPDRADGQRRLVTRRSHPRSSAR
jgi:DNA polymerase (family 10)